MSQTIATPELSPTEWRAVAVALNDATRRDALPAPAGSIRDRLGKVVQLLTGVEAPRPFADPRLETLRRYVWTTRRNRAPALQMAPELIAQGYNCAQIKAIGLLAA